MNTATLVAKAREGDQGAFKTLYESHVDRIYRLVYRMAGEDDLAQDLTQEAFIRAFQRLQQFRGDSAFSTWLHSIAVSVTLNGLRRRKRDWERERPVAEVAALPASNPVSDPVLKDRLHRAIDALPELYRTVFLMFDVEGYSHDEIAEVLDMAVGTSKARLSRARAKLREQLTDLSEGYV